jgi:hypothetical protein
MMHDPLVYSRGDAGLHPGDRPSDRSAASPQIHVVTIAENRSAC